MEISSDEDIDCSNTDSSDSNSNSDSEKEKKKRKKKSKHSKKMKAKKSKKTKSKKRKQKTIRTTGKYGKHLKPTDTYPIHGGHKWAKCRLNNHGDSYDLPSTNRWTQGNQSQGRNNQSQGQE